MTLIIRHISWKNNRKAQTGKSLRFSFYVRKRMPGEADSNGLLLEDGAYPKPLIQRAFCHWADPASVRGVFFLGKYA